MLNLTSKATSFVIQSRDPIRCPGAVFTPPLIRVPAISFSPSFTADVHYRVVKPQPDARAVVLRTVGFEIDQKYLENGYKARIPFAGYGNMCKGTGCSGLVHSAIFGLWRTSKFNT
ncbi:MAG: hypothetical protein MI975_14960 [Cytophagales bacterium]|nr:hypothetical protein [Cytophagales bacterium]